STFIGVSLSGSRNGTTAMLPVSHSLYVKPWRMSGPESFHASSRCFRRTAVRMKRPATLRALDESGTDGGAFEETIFGWNPADGETSAVPLVLGTNLTMAAITPAARTAAATQGSALSQSLRSGRGSRNASMFFSWTDKLSTG